jgi:hypothetical protein
VGKEVNMRAVGNRIFWPRWVTKSLAALAKSFAFQALFRSFAARNASRLGVGDFINSAVVSISPEEARTRVQGKIRAAATANVNTFSREPACQRAVCASSLHVARTLPTLFLP